MQREKSFSLETRDSLNTCVIKLRKLVRFYIGSSCNESALFWADKLATITNGNSHDVYWLAQSMYRCGEYNRAVFLVKKRGLEKTQPLFQWIVGLCLLESGKYSDALLVLSNEGELEVRNHSVKSTTSASFLSTPPFANNHILEGFTPESLRAALLVVKGRIYEKLDRRSCAVECFKQALKCDVYCFDAFQALVQHQMLTSAEEKELMTSLPFQSQCGSHDLLPFVYDQLLNKYQKPAPPNIGFDANKHLSRMTGNLDLKETQAERLFYACAYKQCYSLTEEILKDDPFHRRTLLVHISCLVELKKTNALFYLAHELVDQIPNQAISWYSVGCYYLLTGKHNIARKYLSKSVSVNKSFGPAWLAYGHSFAEENEHDQAMAAYFSAARKMRGCHLPLLYVAKECVLINNVKLAEKFFAEAQTIAPNDPYVIHEMGTIAFHNEDYREAETLFLVALAEVQKNNKETIGEVWEPLLNNLGHTFRKQKKYAEALQYHRQALVISPQDPSTLASIAFVQSLQENFIDAIDTFHKVLSLKRGDIFSLTMLAYLTEHVVYTIPVFDNTQDSKEH